jgi:hypothetical protein
MFTMPNNNSLLSNPFQNNSENTLFSNSYLNNASNNFAEAYKKLELLKQQANGGQPPEKKTVFSEIFAEWDASSDDEKIFIENSKEYIEANSEYQKAFNTFLIEHLGNDFIHSKHGLSAEKLLNTIRNRKDAYKNKFAADIESIKEINSKLEKNNEELAKTNLDLQKQLEDIQKRLV